MELYELLEIGGRANLHKDELEFIKNHELVEDIEKCDMDSFGYIVYEVTVKGKAYSICVEY